MPDSRLSSAIRVAKSTHGIALMPFIAAGYPDLATSLKLIPALTRAGAAAIEVGFPFSDPIADGPTIQEAFTVALARKLKVDDIFAGFESIKGQSAVPLVAMVSYSIVFRFGVQAFVDRAKQSGFAGILIPDLPPPEGDAICRQIQDGGLETVLLVSPSTPESRRERIVSLCSGFVYYLSLAGTTGERDTLPAGIETNVTAIKKLTGVPVCVGFGVGKRAHLDQLAKVADGAIVGSALVKRIKENPSDPVAAVEKFARELLTKA
jgi:tryptophan synthase alpha chain